jgi:hypothetical protein
MLPFDCGQSSAKMFSRLALSQHPDEHCPERPVLLAVDKEFGEGATLRVAPELADPVGPLEVRQHQDVEEFGPSRRLEGLESLTQKVLELRDSGHSQTLRQLADGRARRRYTFCNREKYSTQESIQPVFGKWPRPIRTESIRPKNTPMSVSPDPTTRSSSNRLPETVSVK